MFKVQTTYCNCNIPAAIKGLLLEYLLSLFLSFYFLTLLTYSQQIKKNMPQKKLNKNKTNKTKQNKNSIHNNSKNLILKYFIAQKHSGSYVKLKKYILPCLIESNMNCG